MKRKRKSIFIKERHLRGQWAELLFMPIAAELGFRVCHPWGNTARYDFALERDGRFMRVQVKSTANHWHCGGYICTLGKPGKPYVISEVDFFAVYLVLEDVWYIIPSAILTRHSHIILLDPSRKRQKYGQYLEAWHLLTDSPPSAPAPIASPAELSGDCPGLRKKRCKPNCCQLERLPVLKMDISRCSGIAKTRSDPAPRISLFGCKRLLRCIECYMARTFAHFDQEKMKQEVVAAMKTEAPI